MAAYFFPPIEPYDSFNLPVDDPHILKIDQCGCPDGVPVVFLHGGPGGSCQPAHRRLFDPALFRLILFDQRGCGRSRPKGCLQDNTTPHLVADLEMIRSHLGIRKWLVVGGSWGSTLGLAYAQTHPERVQGLVLRAVFLGQPSEAEWAFQTAAQTFAPQLWRAFRDLLPPSERADPITAYIRRIHSHDRDIQKAAAWVWHDYERALSQITPPDEALPSSLEAAARREGQPNSPYLETWYLQHDFFLPPHRLIDNAAHLATIQGHIIQSRYDLLCPPIHAYRLHQAWPNSQLSWVPGAGHSLEEPGVISALTKAICDLGKR